MEIIKVVILGIIQGVTEFLPISSTGHLIVTAAAINFAGSLGGTFEIFIQLGSVLAVIAFYRTDLWKQIRTVRTDKSVQNLWLCIVVAAIPASIIGFFVRKSIKGLFYVEGSDAINTTGLYVIAATLIIGGIIFLLIERRPKTNQVEKVELEKITLRQALGVGIAQTFALIPGISRSGASIVGGVLGGMNRSTATAFSFYLAIPVLGGATILDLLLSLDEITNGEQVLNLVVGLIVTAIISWIAIGWLLRYVARNNFNAFGVYRIIAGIIIAVLTAAAIL